MKKKIDLVVVIPLGPKCKVDFVNDTIESIYFYVTSSFQIIVMDDSGVNNGDKLKQKFPELIIITTPKTAGLYGGLYITLCRAYKYAIDSYEFVGLLRIDTDALIIGKNPEREALTLFKNQPDVGMAGQYGRQYNGEPWDIQWPKDRILNGTTTWKFIKRPRSNWVLRKLYKQALQHGYIAGESVFGGAYFISEKCIQALDEKDLLNISEIRKANLEEDHIFSLLAKAAGFTFQDLSAGQMPFAMSWKSMPDSPANLLQGNKKIIHSTRKWEDMDEAQIRDYFKQQRYENQELMK